MIDLNVRIDSSLNEDEYRFLAHSQNINIDEVFPKPLVLNYQAKEEDYKELRDFALSLLQTEEAITFAVSSIIHRLFNQNYYYLELALTPYLHSKNKLTQRKILKAALIGINDALEKCPGMDVNLVLYCSREASEDYNTETARLAIEYRDERVVAVGLEGDDKDHPIGEYEKLFARCKVINYPIVIELGKHYNNNNSILKAAQIGAKRIVSPYRLELVNETFQILQAKGVYFEYNPSFDVVNSNIKSYEAFPIKEFWKKGYPCYIASHASGILDASLTKEFLNLSRTINFTRDDVYHSLYLSLQSAFMRNMRERNRVMKRVIDEFDYFYNKTV